MWTNLDIGMLKTYLYIFSFIVIISEVWPYHVEDYFQGNFMVLPSVLWGHVMYWCPEPLLLYYSIHNAGSWLSILITMTLVLSCIYIMYPFMFCHYRIHSGTVNAPHVVHKMLSVLPNYHCQVSAFGEPTTILLLLSWESLHRGN